MSDFFQFANEGEKVWTFVGLHDGGANPLHWEVWQKSWARGCTMLYGLLVGAGGAGGCGFTKAVGAAGGGGGGGSAGGTARFLIPLVLLPEALYLNVPTGPVLSNGVTQTNGGAPYFTIVSTFPDTANGLVAQSSNVAGSSGIRGLATGTGTGGAAPSLATSTGFTLMNFYGFGAFFAGAAGANGGAVTGAAGANGGTGGLTSPGGGGGGSTSANFNGGSVALPYVLGGRAGNWGTGFGTLAGGTGDGGSGADGITQYDSPLTGFFSSGGSGGASTNTAGVAGGNGGAGGWGSGGGGGGAGVLNGGNGGAGGPGVVILVAF